MVEHFGGRNIPSITSTIGLQPARKGIPTFYEPVQIVKLALSPKTYLVLYTARTSSSLYVHGPTVLSGHQPRLQQTTRLIADRAFGHASIAPFRLVRPFCRLSGRKNESNRIDDD